MSAPRRYVDQHGAEHTIRCTRCRKVCRELYGWNSTVEAGVVVGFLCPTCQTPEENAEAEIHEATLEYARDPRSAGLSVVRGRTRAPRPGPIGRGALRGQAYPAHASWRADSRAVARASVVS
jgi:hypothetical protein